MGADVEHAAGAAAPSAPRPMHSLTHDEDDLNPLAPKGSFLNRIFSTSIFETRGIERVPPSATKPFTWRSSAQAFVLWVSINLAAVNVTLGMLGPMVFGLSFVDATLCALFGTLLGSMAVAYMALWGPRGGVRTMIFARFTMGWWPTKLLVLLNLLQQMGYSLINCVVAGQILSAVSPDQSLNVVVGIVIVAVLTLIVTTIGIRVFHFYERYAFIPQIFALVILYAEAGRAFDISTPTAGDPRTVTAARLSFLSLCLSAAITYSPMSADYFVYYAPPRRPVLQLFWPTVVGLTLSFVFALVLGIGLASAVASNAEYAAAASVSQGALLVQALVGPLGNFGRFCGVLVALGTVANTIPPTYSAGVDAQLLGRLALRVPRIVWNAVGVVAYTAAALAGRDYLSTIFTNFLALMGYWVAIWLAITLAEHLLFKRSMKREFVWEDWNNQTKLTNGFAALTAFLVGWAGAILCMAQVYYVGPLAKLVGAVGMDMGNFIGFTWGGLVYIPLRWLELKYIGR